MISAYTLVVTSCARHDLLRQTLDSFIDTADARPRHTIIIEDSDTPKPLWLNETVAQNLGGVTWLQNDVRMGQIYSIDRAYSLVTTDYIFHLEDDWRFVAQTYLGASFDILEKYPEVIMVSLRGKGGWHPLVKDERFPFLIAEPNWRGGWGGFAFNPGLRRLRDYQKLGSYGKYTSYGTHGLGHEMQLSRHHLDQGYVIADLGQDFVVHTGGGRSRSIEPLPPSPRLLIAIPACHKFQYGAWESEASPQYDVKKAWMNRPYGQDIHISSPNNPRIQAIRDTWAKDLLPFAAHVDLRFFYGQSPSPRPLLPDEVLLPCGDTYADLPQKSVEIFRWALAQEYHLCFKCDDDTAVYVDRLVREALEHRFDYAGWTNADMCTGGPGYWLSRRAMKIVAQNGDNPDHWAEDVWIGKLLNRENIHPLCLPSHRPGFAAHWFFPQGFDPHACMEGIVAFHAVQPEVMRAWYAHKETPCASV